ncbi:hypothetical protein Tco_1298607 [Tanacetum coccineum]
MSDAEHSEVTYISISSTYEDLSDIGSPGVVVLGYGGLLMILQDPYAHVEGAFQASPSPDYVPGPEHPPSPDYIPSPKEPEQAPMLPEYVPESEYPEYMLPLDDEAPMEDQPLPADASPTALSLGYIPDSNPEEDDDDDSEGDHADYPTDRGDDDDDDDDNDDDDDDNDEEEDKEEEEHSAPTDSSAIATTDPVPSVRDTEAFETNESAATPPPPAAYRVTARMFVKHQTPTSFPSDTEIPSPPLPASLPLPLPPSPTHITPTYEEAPLGYRAAGIRLREAPLSLVHETEIPKICLLLHKKLCRTAPAPRYEVRESLVIVSARQVGPAVAREDPYRFIDMETSIMHAQIEDAQDDRDLLRGRVNRLFKDRLYHCHTSLLMAEEARHSRTAWAQSMAVHDRALFEGIALWTSDLA